MANILIQTYQFESGLYYLGISLANHLSKNNNIYLLPKLKYQYLNNKYVPNYPIKIKESEYPILKIDGNNAHVQILNYLKENKIATYISLESLMSNNHFRYLKSNYNFKLIDIPMLEWIERKNFYNGDYKIFDEIWTLTNQGFEIFKSAGYTKTRPMMWDFVDRNLFFEDKNPFLPDEFIFYHQASLNPEYSSKNTELVIDSFNLLAKEFDDIKLIITGNIKNTIINDKIKHYSKTLSREEISNIYKITNCVVSPSKREGLGLSLYEAQACGCDLITTNIPPMNEIRGAYLCEVSSIEKDKSLIPIAILKEEEIYNQMKKVYLKSRRA